MTVYYSIARKANGVNRVTEHFPVRVCVNIRGDRITAVAHERLQGPHVATVTKHGGREGVPEAVQGDRWQPQTPHKASVGRVKARGGNSINIRRREAARGAEDRQERRGDGDIPVRRCRFGPRVDDLPAGHALTLVPNVQFLGGEIDVLPAEAANFAPTEAADEAQGQREAVRVVREGVHVCQHLGIRPGLDALRTV